MARIVVAGYMVRYPMAGMQLAYFHYLLGLHRLGHRVAYVEESGGWPDPCYDPETGTSGDDPSPGLRSLRARIDAHRLRIPVWYVHRHSGRVAGGTREELRSALRAADLLLNLGGVCWLPDFRLCRRRVLVDMDPLFTQLGEFGGGMLEEHHVHFSYGANIGRPGCEVPTLGIDWLPTVPPVVPELWRHRAEPAPGAPLTTIANWEAYGEATYRGRRYGQKREEFLRLIDLPRRTSRQLELALAGCDEESRARLRMAGWSVREAGDISSDARSYRSYLIGSRGELSPAKHAYVASRSGWFSDRSVCYLAAGRPVILQETGFTDWLEAGRGVLAFSSVEEAVDCIERLDADYLEHCRAARRIARGTFGYRTVLPRLLEAALDRDRSRPTARSSGRI